MRYSMMFCGLMALVATPSVQAQSWWSGSSRPVNTYAAPIQLQSNYCPNNNCRPPQVAVPRVVNPRPALFPLFQNRSSVSSIWNDPNGAPGCYTGQCPPACQTGQCGQCPTCISTGQCYQLQNGQVICPTGTTRPSLSPYQSTVPYNSGTLSTIPSQTAPMAWPLAPTQPLAPASGGYFQQPYSNGYDFTQSQPSTTTSSVSPTSNGFSTPNSPYYN